jgi:hypothetical protein
VTSPVRAGRIVTVTPEQTAAACRAGIEELGGAFAEDPRTLRRARQLGLTGWAFYVTGRGGVLGDVDPAVVAAAIGFIDEEAVRDGWLAARRVAPPPRIARHHREECCRWGRERLDLFDGVAKLVDLADRVVRAADASGMPLFAAWRALAVPEDGAGARAAVLLHLLREHRAGAHLLAIRSVGLRPLDALLAEPDGEAAAIAFGWQPPYPPPGLSLRKRIWAGYLADRIVGPAYAALEVPERVELIELLASARVAVTAPTGEYPLVER